MRFINSSKQNCDVELTDKGFVHKLGEGFMTTKVSSVLEIELLKGNDDEER